MLTVNQKQQCIVCNKKEFLDKYVTRWNMDLITSLQSQINSQLSGQQQVKAVQSDQRRKHQQAKFWPSYFGMGKVFCYIYYLEKERTINSEYYIALLVWRKKLPKNSHKWRKKALLHQDNALCHKSIATMAKLHELHFELLLHPAYSSDLAPSDYWLFEDLKRMLQGKRLGSNEEAISETEAYFEAKDKSFNKKGIKLLKKHWN